LKENWVMAPVMSFSTPRRRPTCTAVDPSTRPDMARRCSLAIASMRDRSITWIPGVFASSVMSMSVDGPPHGVIDLGLRSRVVLEIGDGHPHGRLGIRPSTARHGNRIARTRQPFPSSSSVPFTSAQLAAPARNHLARAFQITQSSRKRCRGSSTSTQYPVRPAPPGRYAP
jgi:hypothetical protein